MAKSELGWLLFLRNSAACFSCIHYKGSSECARPGISTPVAVAALDKCCYHKLGDIIKHMQLLGGMDWLKQQGQPVAMGG